MMLLLTRRVGETIVVGEELNIEFTVLDINRSQVKIGINAPRDIPIHRKEISDKIKLEALEQNNNAGEAVD
jgi:carbon storage regulator